MWFVIIVLVESIGSTAIAIDADDQSMHLLLPLILLGKASDISDIEKCASDLWSLQLKPRLGPNRNHLYKLNKLDFFVIIQYSSLLITHV